MNLSSDLISQFVKATKDDKKQPSETTVQGTIVYDGKPYVKLDGSDLLTPVSTTTDVEDGERVTVLIKNHTATVTGNLSSPSARTDTVKDLSNQITQFEIIVADKVSTKELDAERGRIDNLVSDNVLIRESLTAANAEIDELSADNVTINEKLTAREAEIKKLETEKLDANAADIKYATIESLEGISGEFHDLESTYAEFQKTVTDDLTAFDADIKNLDAEKLSADAADLKYASVERLEVVEGEFSSLESTYAEFQQTVTSNLLAFDATIKDLDAEKLSADAADLKYANIDFSNIGEAAVRKIFSDTGLIEDLTVGDGTITGELVGVTIKGDLIEGGTVKADKLVVKGSDGLYYKLNFEAGTFAAGEQVPTDSLHGSVITAKSITAEKVSVKDLVAFGATIGGFNISESALYSGAKASVSNSTTGVYLDRDGQMAVGDSNNFIKYYKDTNGNYKLEIVIGSKNVETVVNETALLANEAKTNATAAQTAVNTLATRVTNAETAIEQNSEEIALRATKTEVSNTYATKTALSATDTKATNAATSASNAQSTANTAKSDAATAQTAANNAKSAADKAQSDVNALTTRVTNAETAIEQNAEEITLRATKTEVSNTYATKTALSATDTKAGNAATAASNAQTTANEAKTAAGNAQTTANTAKTNAATAQSTADKAQSEVDALELRVSTAETNITQNSEEIALSATKEEVAQSLGGIYTKEESDANLTVRANEITQSVRDTYVTKEEQESFANNVESNISQLSNEVNISFTSTSEQIAGVNTDLQSLSEVINKHFSFTENGLTITAGNGTMNLVLDNDIISFEKNGQQFGWWDGVNFHTGNIYIGLNQRAQFGNFAFEPRDNGSLDFLKVGG